MCSVVSARKNVNPTPREGVDVSGGQRTDAVLGQTDENGSEPKAKLCSPNVQTKGK